MVQEEEQKELIDSQAARADKLSELWDAYFQAPKPKKAPIMKEYNLLAEEYNSIAKAKLITILTNQTKDSIKTRPVREPELIVAPVAKGGVIPKKEGSVIAQILALHIAGKTNKEIIELGFNKSTVGRQVSEYKKKSTNATATV